MANCSGQNYVISDHYNGSEFYNPEPSDHTFGDMLVWLWEMETVKWPEWIYDPSQPKPELYAVHNGCSFTYINHSTTLIQIDSINILTDPIWSDFAGPVSWLGADRVRDPGVKFDDLPPIGIVLLSHDHFDHLDLPTLKKLVKTFNPVILTGLGLKTFLADEDITNVVELDWWDEYKISDSEIMITFIPARHSSGRGLFDGNETLWGGFVIENNSKRILFAGDTAYGIFLGRIHRIYSSFDLTILPVGNYEKRWFMRNQHMNPEDAVRAHLLLNSKQSVGIHYATFAEHPEQEINAHEKDLEEALDKFNVDEVRFRILKFGERLEIR